MVEDKSKKIMQKKLVRFGAWIEPSQKKYIERYSKNERLSQSLVLRFIIKKWIENNEQR